jgi:2-amino-4-hydroxy-6-hydroxymethyldihydropteridine diphosphokinase
MFQTILVAIGANLASAAGRTPLETCRWAAGQLGQIPGLDLRKVSRWFATQPVPASDQPRFVNGAAWLGGAVEPCGLLEMLQAIEAAAGRVRGVPNAARTLDLDLLAMDDLVMASPQLVLPHPRMQDRAFMLAPLQDLQPDWMHPVLRVSVSTMLAAVSGQDVQAL